MIVLEWNIYGVARRIIELQNLIFTYNLDFVILNDAKTFDFEMIKSCCFSD